MWVKKCATKALQPLIKVVLVNLSLHFSSSKRSSTVNCKHCILFSHLNSPHILVTHSKDQSYRTSTALLHTCGYK